MFIHSIGQLCKQVFKVFIRLQSVCFCTLGDAVTLGTGVCSFHRVDRYPVFLSETEWPDSSFRSLCECSDKLRYPKELLIRTFSREARQIADFPEKCAHNAFILTRIVLQVPHHYPTGAVPLQHQVPPPCRQSSAREAFLLTGWHTIYGWFLHRHVQG